ncbi:hypothetical protein [uncultured Duncaniella sp.]|uniref:hypothetical protein n=1 Tax=uncultured Duncaniella sp. TaxID=2768039 RepID=UPI0027296CBD|nr:hypothetical protein [uncultured Duncaniella sp.]
MKSTDNPESTPTFAGEIFDVVVPYTNSVADVSDSADIFNEDGTRIEGAQVPGYPQLLYMPFGYDNELPFHIMREIGSDEVMSQNLFFNILTAYGSGLQYVDRETKAPTEDPEIQRFMLMNSMREFFLEQCTDMKYYFFAVAVIILNKEGTQIVQVRHKDACYCRFEKADKKGRINHIFYANWKKSDGNLTRKDVEMITLLDEKNPLGHLEVLMGRAPGADGLTEVRTSARKFAVVMRFPTPGQRYYPSPYYTAIFRGDWYDLKKLIGKGKKAKIRNSTSVKYQVEIHRDYWDTLFSNEQIDDPLEQRKRMKKEIENIKNFVTGSVNAGKVWVSSYFIDSYGKEQRMVRINLIDTSKEGGDWSDDIQESSNMMCYGLNIHPNLVGAVPGKSQSNNSGSDKRELFTLKQSLETAFHDMLSKVHELIIFFNGWEKKVRPQVPIVLLTTLDKNTDAVKKNPDGSTSDPND